MTDNNPPKLQGFVKTHQPCPCGESSDGYAIREDGSGFCWGKKCAGKNHFPETYRPEHCERKPLADRGIPSGIGGHFNFYQYEDKKGNILFHGYEYPNGVLKIRRCADKQFWWDKPQGVPTPLFGGLGMYDMPADKTCVIVEGEVDAPSAYFMLNDKMKNERPVYWLTSAGIPAKARQAIYEELSKYDRVILAFESDEAGSKAKEVISEIIPDKVRIATLNKHKDANEYLVAGDEAEFKRAVKNYSRYTPEYIMSGSAKFQEIWEDNTKHFSVENPFKSLREFIPGIPLGRVTLITGQEGIGKTEVLRRFEHAIIESNIADGGTSPVSITHFEEDNRTTLAGLACYDQGVNFRDPDTDYGWGDISPTIDKVQDFLFLTDFYKARDEMSVKSFMSKIEYLHFVLGVKYFCFDPINQLRPDSPEEPLVKFLDGISMEMARFAVDHGIGVLWTAHVTDDGKVRDSRMIAKAADIRIDVSRDLDEYDEGLRNLTHFNVSKNRPFGRTGASGTTSFDPVTFTLFDGSSSFDPTKTFSKEESTTPKSKIPF